MSREFLIGDANAFKWTLCIFRKILWWTRCKILILVEKKCKFTFFRGESRQLKEGRYLFRYGEVNVTQLVVSVERSSPEFEPFSGQVDWGLVKQCVDSLEAIFGGLTIIIKWGKICIGVNVWAWEGVERGKRHKMPGGSAGG